MYFDMSELLSGGVGSVPIAAVMRRSIRRPALRTASAARPSPAAIVTAESCRVRPSTIRRSIGSMMLAARRIVSRCSAVTAGSATALPGTSQHRNPETSRWEIQPDA
jgi:hypothetical protein